MNKINGKTFECYSLKRCVNCKSPKWKNTPRKLIDTFAPPLCKHCNKLETLWIKTACTGKSSNTN